MGLKVFMRFRVTHLQPNAEQGKQLFNVLIRPNLRCSVSVSLEVAERMYTKGLHMCPSDGCVCRWPCTCDHH